jgi:TPR repeat protein
MAAWLAAPLPAAAQDSTESAVRCAAGAKRGDVAACQRAAEENPADVAVRRNLARSLIAVGNFEESINVYRGLARAHPEDAEAHYDLAGTLGFVRLYAEAIPEIEDAIRLRPDHEPYYRLAALLYAHMGRMEESARATLKSAEMGEVTSMYDLVQYYRDGVGVVRDPARALAWARRAAEAGHVAAMRLMARVYAEGLFGQKPDEKQATAWAARERASRIGK